MTDPSVAKVKDPEALIELHERLLFQRAYPLSVRELKLTERKLIDIESRVYKLSDSNIDLSPLDAPEVSGIAGTTVTSNFSYALVRWLAAKFPNQISIDWDWFDSEDQFGATMRRFLPLLAEDAMVEPAKRHLQARGPAPGRHHAGAARRRDESAHHRAQPRRLSESDCR